MLTSCAEFWGRFRAPHSLSFTWCANINVFFADFFVSYDGFYRKDGADRCLHTYMHTYIHTPTLIPKVEQRNELDHIRCREIRNCVPHPPPLEKCWLFYSYLLPS